LISITCSGKLVVVGGGGRVAFFVRVFIVILRVGRRLAIFEVLRIWRIRASAAVIVAVRSDMSSLVDNETAYNTI
jgi:hypothetical protein